MAPTSKSDVTKSKTQYQESLGMRKVSVCRWQKQSRVLYLGHTMLYAFLLQSNITFQAWISSQFYGWQTKQHGESYTTVRTAGAPILCPTSNSFSPSIQKAWDKLKVKLLKPIKFTQWKYSINYFFISESYWES